MLRHVVAFEHWLSHLDLAHSLPHMSDSRERSGPQVPSS